MHITSEYAGGTVNAELCDSQMPFCFRDITANCGMILRFMPTVGRSGSRVDIQGSCQGPVESQLGNQTVLHCGFVATMDSIDAVPIQDKSVSLPTNDSERAYRLLNNAGKVAVSAIRRVVQGLRSQH